ncbi:hypothetical protein BOTBODRAFT_549696 [Botryobasidium botryosum FD-172 SS1]|uniref:Uncharacterized protein n=1 Tax=Botryobasidium botryosum (strain FD-172 SS1) TaxID=930990 RepID=A0A067N1R6_BOTB1|nr:hypothetical protein BOTBODRAFT_549696 [Botryobasidium botryosum FD-172 SS1]
MHMGQLGYIFFLHAHPSGNWDLSSCLGVRCDPVFFLSSILSYLILPYSILGTAPGLIIPLHTPWATGSLLLGDTKNRLALGLHALLGRSQSPHSAQTLSGSFRSLRARSQLATRRSGYDILVLNGSLSGDIHSYSRSPFFPFPRRRNIICI